MDFGFILSSAASEIFSPTTAAYALAALGLAADLKYVGALFIMIVVLLFRPQGILGRRERVG